MTGTEEEIPSHDVATGNLEIQVNPASEEELSHQDNPASPVRASTPPIVEENKEDSKDNSAGVDPETKARDNMVVTSEHCDPAPETSMTLAKIISKNYLPSKEKGKASLQSLENFDVTSLHHGFLTRLSESQDTEIAMANTLKRKYESVCAGYAEQNRVTGGRLIERPGRNEASRRGRKLVFRFPKVRSSVTDT